MRQCGSATSTGHDMLAVGKRKSVTPERVKTVTRKDEGRWSLEEAIGLGPRAMFGRSFQVLRVLVCVSFKEPEKSHQRLSFQELIVEGVRMR